MKSMIIRKVMAVGCMALSLWVVSCSNANTGAAEDEVNSDSAEVQTEQIVWGDIGLPTMYAVHSLECYIENLEDVYPEIENYLEIDKESILADSVGSLKIAKMYIQEISSWRHDRVLSDDDFALLKLFLFQSLGMLSEFREAATKAMKKRRVMSDYIQARLCMHGEGFLAGDLSEMMESLPFDSFKKEEMYDLYKVRERRFSELQAKGE